MTQILEKYQSIIHSTALEHLFSASIIQLQKDAQMANLDFSWLGGANNSQKAVEMLAQWLQHYRHGLNGFDNFLYRVDLPTEVVVKDMSDNDLALIILARSMQKVWLREQFSKMRTKDEEDGILKDLKP